MRNGIFKKHLSLFVALVFVLTAIPMSPVFTADSDTLYGSESDPVVIALDTVSADGDGYTYRAKGEDDNPEDLNTNPSPAAITVNRSGYYKLTQAGGPRAEKAEYSSTIDYGTAIPIIIKVADNLDNVVLIMAGVNIDLPRYNDKTYVTIGENSHVTIQIAGINKIGHYNTDVSGDAGETMAKAIRAETGSTLTITEKEKTDFTYTSVVNYGPQLDLRGDTISEGDYIYFQSGFVYVFPYSISCKDIRFSGAYVKVSHNSGIPIDAGETGTVTINAGIVDASHQAGGLTVKAGSIIISGGNVNILRSSGYSGTPISVTPTDNSSNLFQQLIVVQSPDGEFLDGESLAQFAALDNSSKTYPRTYNYAAPHLPIIDTSGEGSDTISFYAWLSAGTLKDGDKITLSNGKSYYCDLEQSYNPTFYERVPVPAVKRNGETVTENTVLRAGDVLTATLDNDSPMWEMTVREVIKYMVALEYFTDELEGKLDTERQTADEIMAVIDENTDAGALQSAIDSMISALCEDLRETEGEEEGTYPYADWTDDQILEYYLLEFVTCPNIYQWLRFSEPEAIEGATGRAYTVTEADAGHGIGVAALKSEGYYGVNSWADAPVEMKQEWVKEIEENQLPNENEVEDPSKPDTYTVTFRDGEEEIAGIDRQTVTAGERAARPLDPAKSGRVFAGWYKEKALNNVFDFDAAITGNTDIYAKWNEAPASPPTGGGDSSAVKNEEPETPEAPHAHYAYITGHPNGTVRPGANISREELAVIIFRLLDDDTRGKYYSKTNAFSDVKAERWSNTAISTVSKMGVTLGYPSGKFAPANPMTRAEVAAMLTRLYGDKEAPVTAHSFSDADNHWAAPEIAKGYAFGLISGYPDGSFRPDAHITRAEVITLINKITKRCVLDDPDDMLDGMIVWSDNADTGMWYYYAVQEASNSHECVQEGDNHYWTKLIPNKDWSALED
jgi:uncharacterized repeat protein (TIGR02543 family)